MLIISFYHPRPNPHFSKTLPNQKDTLKNRVQILLYKNSLVTNTVYCAFSGELLSGMCLVLWNSTSSFLVHVFIYFSESLLQDCSARLLFVHSCRNRPTFPIIQVNRRVLLHSRTVRGKKIRNNDQIKIRKRNQQHKTSRNTNVELLSTDYLPQTKIKTALQLLLRNGNPLTMYKSFPT